MRRSEVYRLRRSICPTALSVQAGTARRAASRPHPWPPPPTCARLRRNTCSPRPPAICRRTITASISTPTMRAVDADLQRGVQRPRRRCGRTSDSVISRIRSPMTAMTDRSRSKARSISWIRKLRVHSDTGTYDSSGGAAISIRPTSSSWTGWDAAFPQTSSAARRQNRPVRRCATPAAPRQRRLDAAGHRRSISTPSGKEGTAHNVVMRFKDVPIFYTPYMSFPLGDERKSGLLFPSFGHSRSNGWELEAAVLLQSGAELRSDGHARHPHRAWRAARRDVPLSDRIPLTARSMRPSCRVTKQLHEDRATCASPTSRTSGRGCASTPISDRSATATTS